MKRKYLMVSAVILLSVIYASHALAAGPKDEEAVYVANFNYASPSQETPGSAGVTFGIADVSYQSNSFTPWLTWPQFANLDTAIKNDLIKIFAAKGFNVRGPFESHDLIPYPDKKAIDLYVVPAFELSCTTRGFKGPVKINGKFTLALKEIVTGELMWYKAIPLSKFDFPQRGVVKFRDWGNQAVNDETVISIGDLDVGPRNDMAKGIEKQYPELMATIFKLIDPEEMGIIKKQCQELKSKKGY